MNIILGEFRCKFLITLALFMLIFSFSSSEIANAQVRTITIDAEEICADGNKLVFLNNGDTLIITRVSGSSNCENIDILELAAASDFTFDVDNMRFVMVFNQTGNFRSDWALTDPPNTPSQLRVSVSAARVPGVARVESASINMSVMNIVILARTGSSWYLPHINIINTRLTNMQGFFDPTRVSSSNFAFHLPGSSTQDRALNRMANAARQHDQSPSSDVLSFRPSGENNPLEAMAREAGIGFWTDGRVTFGGFDVNNNRAQFTNWDIGMGLDRRMSENLIAGISVSYGHDRTKLDNLGSRLNSTSFSGSLYALYRLNPEFFISGIAGYSHARLDSRRFEAADSSILGGKRGVDVIFGSLTVTRRIEHGDFTFSPYLRANFAHSAFRSFAEGGTNANRVSYGALRLTNLGASIGAEARMNMSMSNGGTLQPFARLQYSHTSGSKANQSFFVSDTGPASAQSVGLGSISTNVGSAELGMLVLFGRTTSSLSYTFSAGDRRLRAHALRASIRADF